MVCTKSKLYITLPDDDLIRDQIPLHEIIGVDVMREVKGIEGLLTSLKEPQKSSRRASRVSVNSVESSEDASAFISLNAFQVRAVHGSAGFIAIPGCI